MTLIKDLPKQYKELALKNQELQGNKRNPNMDLSTNMLTGNFKWENTPEGWDFWAKINRGEYSHTPSSEISMKITKTEKIKVKGKHEREVTIAVVVSEGQVRAGYSVRLLGDKKVKNISETIAVGRAMKDKTNLIDDMVMGIGMDKKYILYAIAESILKRIERGSLEIVGVR